MNNNLRTYPHLTVITLFAGIGSVVGGLIAELALLFIFQEANFVQIGYQPLLYVSLLGFIPALLTGIIIASQKLWRKDNKSIRTTFLVGFITSDIYMGAIVLYLGINSWIEVGVLLAFMGNVGVFGCIALPKACKSYFDISAKKVDGGSNTLSFTK